MKAAKNKIKWVNLAGPGKLISSIASGVADNVDEIKDLGKKLKFWKN